ncbi:MAG TPA: class I SAM-dependent methyltransferase [Polyangia bacterium]
MTVRFATAIDPQTKESFSVLQCPACQLGHTKPQPPDLGPYYGAAYHGGRHAFTSRFCIRRRLRLLRQAAGNGRPGRLLDVGCGDGSFLAAAGERDRWQVAGTEINPDAARKKGLEVRESIKEIGKLAGPFRCITLWHSLEHLRDPRAALASLAELLEPGGVLLVAVPNAAGWQARTFGARWFHLDVPRHLFHFSRKALTLAFQSAGLTPFLQWNQEFEYDLFGWSQSALNQFMPTPNAFFHHLTGKLAATSRVERMANLAAGLALTALSVPAVFAGAILNRGGTLVMAARKADANEPHR